MGAVFIHAVHMPCRYAASTAPGVPTWAMATGRTVSSIAKERRCQEHHPCRGGSGVGMGGDACVALRPQTKVDLRRPEESSGRGEGGWVDVVWAFMVARGEGHLASPMVGYYVV